MEAEKRKLLNLIKKKSVEQGNIRRAREKENKLKRDIERLTAIAKGKKQGSERRLNRLITKARSPETRARIIRAKSKVKKGWAAFQRFADKYGD